MPIKLTQQDLDTLDFDFDQALEEYREAMEAHATTVNTPAPTAHSWVESAYRANGWEITDNPKEAISS